MDTQIFMIPTEKILVAAEKRRAIRSDQTNAVQAIGRRRRRFARSDHRRFCRVAGSSRPTMNTSRPLTLRRDIARSTGNLCSKPSKSGPKHLGGEPVEEPFYVLESGLKFEIDFRAGYSPGLFLDQRINRAQAPQPRQGQDTSEHIFLHLRLRRGSSHRRRLHGQSRSVTPLSRLGKTELRNQPDQLGRS